MPLTERDLQRRRKAMNFEDICAFYEAQGLTVDEAALAASLDIDLEEE